MKGVPLAVVLRAVLARVPQATFVNNRDCLEITTRRQALIEAARRIVPLRPSTRSVSIPAAGVTDINQYGMEAVRTVGELVYWHHVMNDNARVIAKEVRPATRDRRP